MVTSMGLSLDLPGDASAPAVARRFVRESISDGRLRADALIVVSELVANAWQHGAPPLRMVLELDQDAPSATRLSIKVMNHCPEGSTCVAELILGGRPDGHGGRGIDLVAHLADDWGWQVAGSAMTVWAQLMSQEPAVPRDPSVDGWAATT